MEDAVKSQDASAFVKALLECSSLGEGDVVIEETASSLKLKYERIKEFLTKSVTIVNSKITEANKAQVTLDVKSGETVLSIEDVQFFEPRGRFKLVITTESVVLEGKQFSTSFSLGSISHLACIPSNCSAKKEGEDFLAIKLSRPAIVNGKESFNFLCNMCKSPSKLVPTKDGQRELESIAITSALAEVCKTKIVRPQNNLFQTTGQKSFLRCYKGTQEGAIYPLKNGVIFVKPLLFIPADEISSLTAGRGGGSGNTKYVDLKIETTSDKVHEFTNIEREELAALQLYVKGYLEARSKQSAIKAENNNNNNNGVDLTNNKSTGGSILDTIDSDDDDDSEDDDDYDDETASQSENDSDDSGSSASDAEDFGSDDEDDDDVGEKPQKKSKDVKKPTKSDKTSKMKQNKKAEASNVDLTSPVVKTMVKDEVIDIENHNVNIVKQEPINLIEKKSVASPNTLLVKRERTDNNNDAADVEVVIKKEKIIEV